MHEFFDVVASSGAYRVVVGHDKLVEIIAQNPDALFLVDDFLADDPKIPADRTILVKATEEAKSLENIPQIILKLRQAGANRRTHLVAIGGGVVQDVATFAASVYMRGMSWTYLPTTLLGMADSCIGGKSSINVLGYKNLVGNYYPPQQVVVDIGFATSLSDEMVVGGLFEAGKICYAHSYETFLAYLSDKPQAQMQLEGLDRIIVRALKTKKWFIETDEFDQKERLLLNFGHTFGHALEAGTDFGVSHGIAVGVGMMVAVNYARAHAWLNEVGVARTGVLVAHIEQMIGKGESTLVSQPSVIPMDRILEKFGNDKKHMAAAFRVVCPREDGDLELVDLPKTDQVMSDIRHAFLGAFGILGWLAT